MDIDAQLARKRGLPRLTHVEFVWAVCFLVTFLAATHAHLKTFAADLASALLALATSFAFALLGSAPTDRCHVPSFAAPLASLVLVTAGVFGLLQT